MKSPYPELIDEIEEADPLVRAVKNLDRLQKDARDPLTLLFAHLSGGKKYEANS